MNNITKSNKTLKKKTKVGLLGGCMYVNVIYDILTDRNILPKDKELCVNITSLYVNVGITFSSVYELIMDNTFFSDLVAKSNTH